MVYVYLIYGLAFFLMGVVLLVQTRTPILLLPRASMLFLAVFGLAHGAHEWVEMLELVQSSDSRAVTLLRGIAAVLLAFFFFRIIRWSDSRWSCSSTRGYRPDGPG